MSTVLYVHGMSVHPSGYSDPWWKSLSMNLPSGWKREEANYSSIIGPWMAKLPNVLLRGLLGWQRWWLHLEEWGVLLGIGCLDDLPRYCGKKSRIIESIDGKYRGLNDTDVFVIAHGLGCVAAWEWLQERRRPVRQLILCSSPVGCPANRWLGISMRRPESVFRVVNLGMREDRVAFRISPNLKSTDIENFDFSAGLETDTGESAFFHSLYFAHQNAKLLAGYLQ